jgi:hypothetical protein
MGQKPVVSLQEGIERIWEQVVEKNRSRDSDWLRAGVPVGVTIFTSPRRPDQLWGPPQPPIQWVLGALSPGVKWPGREADHSPPTSAEVKKMWIYTSTLPYAFRV